MYEKNHEENVCLHKEIFKKINLKLIIGLYTGMNPVEDEGKF